MGKRRNEETKKRGNEETRKRGIEHISRTTRVTEASETVTEKRLKRYGRVMREEERVVRRVLEAARTTTR